MQQVDKGERLPRIGGDAIRYTGRNRIECRGFFHSEKTDVHLSTHQFIASGFYIHLPHRRTEYTKQSAAWRSLGSVLMYLSEGDSNSWYTAIRRIFIPFETGAWGVVAGYGLAILTLFIIFVILFLPKWEPDSAMKWFFTPSSSSFSTK